MDAFIGEERESIQIKVASERVIMALEVFELTTIGFHTFSCASFFMWHSKGTPST